MEIQNEITLRDCDGRLYTVTSGKSAYEIAVEEGFIGTKEEWLDSLKGSDGAPGIDGVDGRDGIDGQDGKDGIRA